jgi:hypothetical protein
VVVQTTEDYPSAGGAPARQFYIFAVSAPTAWPTDRGLGLPSVATSNVTSSADTATRPDPPPEVIDQIADAAAGFGSNLAKVATVAVGGAIFIALLWTLTKARGRKK